MACDFLAVYHLRINPQFGEFAGLTGFEFLRYASRLPVYRGAVANEVARVVQAAEPSMQGSGTEMLPSDHPLFADLIDFG